MLLAPAGLLAYAGWVGGIPAYLRIQNGWGNGFDFGAAYGRFVWHQLTTSPAAGVGLLVFVGLVVWALVACVRQRPPLGPVRRILSDQPGASGAVSCKAEDRPRTGPYLGDSTTQQMAVPGGPGPARSAGQALAGRAKPPGRPPGE
jgi:hypothetical protein